MPLQELKCPSCGKQEERLVKDKEEPLCSCGEVMKIIITGDSWIKWSKDQEAPSAGSHTGKLV